jgi:hypothetical protein
MSYLLVVAAVVVAAPIAAAVLVTVASLREDASRSLTGRPPGWLTAAARRLLSLRTSADAEQGADVDSPTSAGAEQRPAELPPTDPLLQSYADLEIPPPRSNWAESDWADRTLTMRRS